MVVTALTMASIVASPGATSPAAAAGCDQPTVSAGYLDEVRSSARSGQIWRLYAAFFERQPDRGGFEFWLASYNRLGGERIAEAFARSEEFVDRFGRISDGAFVDLVYDHVLCRTPDRAGRSFWTTRLRDGLSRGEVMLAFSDSDEFRDRTMPAWREVFRDDFDANGAGWRGLDRSVWDVHTGAQGGFNGEIQCFRQENVDLRDGTLRLTARPQQVNCDAGRRSHTSGSITTEGNRDWTYGRFEVRARFPATDGMWPAIWMMPSSNTYGIWPYSGELDIVEAIGRQPDHVVGTAHWAGADGRPRMDNGWIVLGDDAIADWHTYTLEWSPGRLVWEIDGVAFHEVRGWHPVNGRPEAPFDQPYFLTLSLFVGGEWPGSPNATTDFPATMEVDWVRVLQR